MELLEKINTTYFNPSIITIIIKKIILQLYFTTYVVLSTTYDKTIDE